MYRRHAHMVDSEGTGLLIVDVQERFAPAIAEFEQIVNRVAALARGVSLFGLPVLLTEQYPRGLGKTAARVQEALDEARPVEKICFSCAGAAGFLDSVHKAGLHTLILCGVETHVCVNQTALDLLEAGLRVHVAVDAIGSRSRIDHETALRKMEQAGVIPATVEMCLFELTKTAGAEQFKAIQALIK